MPRDRDTLHKQNSDLPYTSRVCVTSASDRRLDRSGQWRQQSGSPPALTRMEHRLEESLPITCSGHR